VPHSTRSSQLISAFHILNMNIWGFIGGYDAMVARFPYAPFSELATYVAILMVPQHFYVPAFAKPFFLKVGL